MKMENIEKVGLLRKALSAIAGCCGKTFVVKYGGSAMDDEEQKKAMIQDIVLMKKAGLNFVVVHGGGKKINELSQKLGLSPKFVNGLRVTDEETMEVVEMVLSGTINKGIVSLINRCGGKSVGLSGKDAGLLMAERELKNGDIGLVGKIKSVNTEILDKLIREGYIPVVSPVAFGEDGNTYNINAVPKS
jgi:acetylglutamate kinase